MSGLVSHGEKKQLTGLSAIGNDPLLLLLLGRGGGSCVLEVSAACPWGYWFASQGMKQKSSRTDEGCGREEGFNLKDGCVLRRVCRGLILR